MSWCNSYTPPVSADQVTEAEFLGPALDSDQAYDLNFCYPINTAALESARVKLTPFLPRVHGPTFFAELTAHPEVYEYIPIPHPKTLAEMLVPCELLFRRDSGSILFAVLDKTHAGPFDGAAFAGVIGLYHTSPQTLSTELAYVLVLPQFQRTHVLTNATGILLNYSLNLPNDPSAPGLGMRKVLWQANSRNAKSIRAAERMGFRYEGLMRWTLALPEGHEGHTPREGDPLPRQNGRDSVHLGLCWDDWESGEREKVKAAMDRQS
ncbi:hypothetical protein M0805_009573 [Coniferiporia weirii]|nr:hypothetical protein M0805_009573 [Coniferiporia weirii]